MQDPACASASDPRLVGDPINVISGANTDRALDFQLGGPLRLDWYRYYDSSQNLRKRSLGWGHGHVLDRRLVFDLDGMRYTGPDGREIAFRFLEWDGATDAADGVTLRRLDNHTYAIEMTGQPSTGFRFNHFGQPAVLERLYKGEHQILCRYGPDARLNGIIDSLNRWIEIRYDDMARTMSFFLHEVQGQQPRPLLDYRFDEAGNLVEGVDPYRSKFSYRWDPANRMIAKTDRLGYTFRFEYDAQGRCVRSAGQDGIEDVTLSYADGEGLTTVLRGDGGKWTYFHDETGFLYQVVDPYGGARVFKPDAQGRTTEEIDPNGVVTKTVYDDAGQPLGKVSPFGDFYHEGETPPDPVTFNAPGNPLEYELGAFLHAASIVPPSWKSEGPQAVPGHLQRHFTILPRPSAQPGEDRLEIEAEALRTLEPPRKLRDPFLRTLKETAPGRIAKAWAYDRNGNVTAFRDFDGAVSKYEFTSWNHLEKEIDPLGREIRYGYDAGENIVKAVDAGGAEHRYEYDLKGRLSKVIRLGRTLLEYRYDLADNIVEKRDGEGRVLEERIIGERNLAAERRFADGIRWAFTHDKKGRVLSAEAPCGKATFAYDPLTGYLSEDLREGMGVRHVFTYRKQASTKVLGKFPITYLPKSHDIRTVVLPTGKVITLKNLGNGLVLRDFPNGSQEWAQYDHAGRCLAKVATGSEHFGQEWIRRYSYSGEGDLLEDRDTRYGSIGYRYDAAHRLAAEINPHGLETAYEFDAGDNLIAKPGLTGTSMLEGNRLGTANGDRLDYDDRNRLSARAGASGETVYRYDGRGQLAGISSDGREWWTAEYDALGRRVRKTVHGEKWEYWWDGERLAAETDPKGKLRVYVYSHLMAWSPIAFVDYASADAEPASGAAYFIFSNHQGAPVLIKDAAGNAVWNARIEAYGEAQLLAGEGFHMPLRWPGHYRDAETGLHYNRYRYYSPELGRYLQPDPAGIAGGINLYAYGSANPLRFVDPRGLMCADAAKKKASKKKKQPFLSPEEGTGTGQRWPDTVPPDLNDMSDEDLRRYVKMRARELKEVFKKYHSKLESRVTLSVGVMQTTEGRKIVITTSDDKQQLPEKVIKAMKHKEVFRKTPPEIIRTKPFQNPNWKNPPADQGRRKNPKRITKLSIISDKDEVPYTKASLGIPSTGTQHHAEQRMLNAVGNNETLLFQQPTKPCCLGCLKVLGRTGELSKIPDIGIVFREKTSKRFGRFVFGIMEKKVTVVKEGKKIKTTVTLVRAHIPRPPSNSAHFGQL